MKVNVDSAVSGRRGVSSVAAICRNRDGLYLGDSSVVFRGITDPTTLKALAVREAMALAKDLNLQDIHVASDCKVVVDDMKLGGGAAYGAIIHEIIEYSIILNSCNFAHDHEFRIRILTLKI